MKLNKMSQEDLELLSYTTIAELYLKENKVTLTTAELFKKVCELLHMTDDEYQNSIADFFQSLSTTKEFILLNNGKWDLKINHKVKVNIDELYEEKEDDLADDENDEIEEIADEIEDDYNSTTDDDYVDDDLADLSIVDEEDMNKEEE